MLVLAVAILAVAQNDDYTTNNNNFEQMLACEQGPDLAEPACSSAYSITDSRYCVSGNDGTCVNLYKYYQYLCNIVNRPSRSYTDLRDWNATFPIELNLDNKLVGCAQIIAVFSDIGNNTIYTADERDQITAACNQMCVASDDSEDDNQLGLILGLSLGLGLPAIMVLIYFLVIRPNQKKNGTRNTVDTEPLM